jgi:SAM-dependent methyltransferase
MTSRMGGSGPEGWWETFFRGPWLEVQLADYPQEQTRDEVSFIIEAMELPPGARILDIPCGEGRHAIEFARRGYQVSGVDFNEGAIAAAERRASEAGVAVHFETLDMRKLDNVDGYDAAMCYFGSFGHFDDRENLDFARRVFRSLRPGGRFLLDLHVTESLYPIFSERHWTWATHYPPVRIVEERRLDLESGRVESSWLFVGPETSVERSLSIRLYSYRELRDLLLGAGFSACRAFESGKLEAFKLGSRRLAMVAEKGGGQAMFDQISETCSDP